MNNYGGCLSPRPTANQSITPQDSDLSQDEESGNLLYISYFWHMPQLLLSSGLKLISETCFNIGGLLEGFASLPEIQILFSKYEFNSSCQIISLSFLFDFTKNHIGPVSFRHGMWLFNQIMQIFKLLWFGLSQWVQGPGASHCFHKFCWNPFPVAPSDSWLQVSAVWVWALSPPPLGSWVWEGECSLVSASWSSNILNSFHEIFFSKEK